MALIFVLECKARKRKKEKKKKKKANGELLSTPCKQGTQLTMQLFLAI